jgi:O-methyltransferase
VRHFIARACRALLRKFGYELVRTGPARADRDRNPDVSEREWAIYSTVAPFTMLSLERVIANVRAIDHIVRYRIPGDIVECGVWRGGSAMAMLLALEEREGEQRRMWLYDTFAGMTPPTPADLTHDGMAGARLLEEARQQERLEESLVAAYASLEDVRRNIEAHVRTAGRVRFVEGPVERTIPAEMPDRIAVLRIDTDWYESTRHELIHLYPRLEPGGILIIDDYGHWQGARAAVDEYFEGTPVFLHRIDYTGRLIVKPAATGDRLSPV